MSYTGIAALISAMDSDASLRGALGATRSAEDFVAVAASNGFEISLDDLVGHLSEVPLSDVQLEAVGGGKIDPNLGYDPSFY